MTLSNLSKNGTFALAVLAYGMSGCSTTSKSLGLGGGIGAGLGAAIGGIADPGKNGEYRTRNILIGATAGGMAGMMTGAILHESAESQKQDAYQAGEKAGSSKPSVSPPALKQPKVESRWVESRVVGNRYIEGHFEHLITEPTVWDAN
jgi:hypothetical protein